MRASQFALYESLPSDYLFWLTRMGAKMLRKEISLRVCEEII